MTLSILSFSANEYKNRIICCLFQDKTLILVNLEKRCRIILQYVGITSQSRSISWLTYAALSYFWFKEKSIKMIVFLASELLFHEKTFRPIEN